jgi:hypothetical protein
MINPIDNLIYSSPSSCSVFVSARGDLTPPDWLTKDWRSASERWRQAPDLNPAIVKGPMATRFNLNTLSPNASIMRRIWRLRPSRKTTSYS